MKLDTIFQKAGIQEGMVVADIGCHEGYLSMHLARVVGPGGKVYAEDVNSYRLQRLEKTAREREISNITTIHGDYDNPKLPTGRVDLIFVIDTYHEIHAYEKVLGHFHDALKTNGKIVVLEKLKEHLKGASRSAQTKGHTLAPKYVKAELKKAGFTLIDEVLDHGQWERDPEKQMWFVVARKSED